MKIKKYTLIMAQQDLPQRSLKANKTHGGKALIFAGSRGLWGAGVLCARAAARVGAGYVYLWPSVQGFPSVRHPDFLLFDPSQKKEISRMFKAIAIGPGVDSDSVLAKQIQFFKKIKFPNVVLDAGALAALAKAPTVLRPTWILTPHEGEMAKLLRVSSAWVRENRKEALRQAQKKFGCVILLKGHQTLIADAESTFQVQSGNVALAKAGTGDVLTGMITGLLSQGLDSLSAACLAAYCHGAIADRWLKDKKDYLSLMASDVVEGIPEALKRLRS